MPANDRRLSGKRAERHRFHGNLFTVKIQVVNNYSLSATNKENVAEQFENASKKKLDGSFISEIASNRGIRNTSKSYLLIDKNISFDFLNNLACKNYSK